MAGRGKRREDVMKTYAGGETVKGGYYWNLDKWEEATVQGDSGALPGAKAERYVALPMPAVFVAAPLMGALFVMFLPFIGFALAVRAAASATARAVRSTGADLAAVVTPGWRPGEAHMQGKRPDENAPAAPAADDGLAPLAKELDDKRDEKPVDGKK